MIPWSLALALSSAYATELEIRAADGQKAVVLVDEYVKGETPVLTDADPGEVTLAFRNSMFGPVLFTQKVTVPASGRVAFVVDLEQRTVSPAEGAATPTPPSTPTAPPATPVATEIPAGKGAVAISSSEVGVPITVDGKDTGAKTPATLHLDPGKHVVSLAQGCLSGTEEFTVTAGAEQALRVPVAGAKVMLELSTTPAGAQIHVDGTAVGTTPFNLKATCGERTIAFTLEGHRTVERTLTLTDQDLTLDIPLEREAWGALEVAVDPADTVIKIDGETVGTGSVLLDQVAVGDHELTLERDGVEVQRRTVKITEGGQAVLTLVVGDPTARPPKAPKQPKSAKAPKVPSERNGPSAGRVLLNSAVTLGAVPLISFGTYNYAQARVAYQDYTNHPDDAAADRIYRDEVLPRRNLAYLEWGAGGALLLGGTALWVTSFLDAPVVIAPTRRGFVLSGRF